MPTLDNFEEKLASAPAREKSTVMSADLLIRNEELWEFLNGKDLVIIAENKEKLQIMVLKWQETWERGAFRVKGDNTESLVTSKEGMGRPTVHEVEPQIMQFRYLGSTISQEGGYEAVVDNRIKAVWGHWRVVVVVLCDKKMSIKREVKIYSDSDKIINLSCETKRGTKA
ncbi:uncharacterized protein [Palaemon carinicauda]|uniref:uncharacterized protein n=1 Tax=Palaemon carinicauda TaxID=392227 RepID=UPI0035B65971